ncbi:MAG: thiopurine S-methyltransferase [Pirellulaceae bacterium]|nr:thiopurine S-methyltransferase [Pirellulaceae bacterium]
MKTKLWKERWKNNRIGFHQEQVNAHLQDFWSRLNPKPKTTVFVPLCGKSNDLRWLRSQGHSVLGVEVSPIAVRDFFAENQLQPTVSSQGSFERWEADGTAILLGDYFSLTAEDVEQCETIFDRAALIALPLEMRVDYVEHSRRLFRGGRNTLLSTLEYDQSTADGPPFCVMESEVHRHFGNDYAISLLRTTNVLDELGGLRKRGVSTVDEKVFQLITNRD